MRRINISEASRVTGGYGAITSTVAGIGVIATDTSSVDYLGITFEANTFTDSLGNSFSADPSSSFCYAGNIIYTFAIPGGHLYNLFASEGCK